MHMILTLSLFPRLPLPVSPPYLLLNASPNPHQWRKSGARRRRRSLDDWLYFCRLFHHSFISTSHLWFMFMQIYICRPMGDSTITQWFPLLLMFRGTRARTHEMDTATCKYWDTSYKTKQIGPLCLSYKQREEEEGKEMNTIALYNGFLDLIELEGTDEYRSRNAFSSCFASPSSSQAFSNFRFISTAFLLNSSPCSPRHASRTSRISLSTASRVPFAASPFLSMGFNPSGPVRISISSKATLRVQLRWALVIGWSLPIGQQILWTE